MSDKPIMPPAQYVAKIFIEKIGGIRATAKYLNIQIATLSKWQSGHPQYSGRIPSHLQRKLYDLAQELELDLTLPDLIFGREQND